MIYFVHSNGISNVVWYIGERKPALLHAEEYIEVFADGPELAFIRRHMVNIPIPKGNNIIWNGILARFIAENFPFPEV